MYFGSLFAGIGGLDLGLERAGLECKWQVEINDYATKVLEKHWGDVRRWRDITTFPPDAELTGTGDKSREIGGQKRKQAIACKPETIRQAHGEACAKGAESGDSNIRRDTYSVDLICAGFPCQDISYAGRGDGIEGERSGLFFEAIRVVRLLRPRYVLLENVAALLTRGLDRVHGELAQIGYCSESHCIPAAALGAPHIRDRVFILAYTDHSATARQREYGGQADGESEPEGSGDCGYSRGAVANTKGNGRQQGEQKRRGRKKGTGAGKKSRSGNGSKAVANTGITRLEKQEGEDAGREGAICGTKPVGSEWWSIEPDVGRVAYGVSNRVDRLKCLGNAVVPQVAQWIGERIVLHDQAAQK